MAPKALSFKKMAFFKEEGSVGREGRVQFECGF